MPERLTALNGEKERTDGWGKREREGEKYRERCLKTRDLAVGGSLHNRGQFCARRTMTCSRRNQNMQSKRPDRYRVSFTIQAQSTLRRFFRAASREDKCRFVERKCALRARIILSRLNVGLSVFLSPPRVHNILPLVAKSTAIKSIATLGYSVLY